MHYILESLEQKIVTIFIQPISKNTSSGLPIALIIIIVSSAFFFVNRTFIMENLSNIGGITKKYSGTNTFRRWMPRAGQINEEILERGGYIAGLVNDGNTCFMNSVIQSLASSKELLKFLDEEIAKKYDLELKDEAQAEVEEAPSAVASTVEKKPKGKSYGRSKRHANRKLTNDQANEEASADLKFTFALKEMLSKLNAKYYKDTPCFKTNALLKSMSKSPNKNMLLGYDQEDAQEFFQTILSELEKDAKSLETTKLEKTPIPEYKLGEDSIIGQAHLNRVGTVYLPSEQIDPNLVLQNKGKNIFTPFKLVTPLDGITAERIGCLQCGENGGIRYSVSSGLSLNLPSEGMGSTLRLSDLLNDWIKPEIIEGVECNRCALNAVRDHLLEQLKQYESKGSSIPDKLLKAFQMRIEELEQCLAKPVVDDEDYKKLHTENMVRKCSKSKQILFLRPPPLLSIHINRSVFDPRTYMIRKNNSRVLFKSRLNLSPWCCDVDEINLDARLPMSKKGENMQDSSEDENLGGEYYAKLHQTYEKEFEDSDEEGEVEQNEDRYVNRDVSNYDPLNGDLDSVSSFSNDDAEEDNDEYLEETDALGNTTTRRVTKQENRFASEDDEGSVEIEIRENGEDGISSSDSEDDQEPALPAPAPPVSRNPIPSSVPAGPLTYVLRSVIVHYGTHNYGHYIAFRKYRGCWWRISDETVYIVEEAEVLSTPGVFMLFYEYDYDESSGKMKDDLGYLDDEKVESDEEQQDNSIEKTNGVLENGTN